HDVAVVQRVGEMTCILGGYVDAMTVAGARGLPKGLLHDDVRRASIAVVLADVVARVHANEQIARRDERAGTDRLEQMVDDDVVARVRLGGNRRQCQYSPRGVQTDAAAELHAAGTRLAVEIAVELRGPGDVDLLELVPMQL